MPKSPSQLGLRPLHPLQLANPNSHPCAQVLLRWTGEPLDLARLEAAVAQVMRHQPMLCHGSELRAESRRPGVRSHPLTRLGPTRQRVNLQVKDATDLLLGCRNSGLSTTAAAVWSLLNELGLFTSWPWLRWAVKEALYLSWPRTLIRKEARFQVPVLRPGA